MQTTIPGAADMDPGDVADREVLVEASAWRAAPFATDEAERTVAEAGDAAAAEIGLGDGVGWAVLLTDDEALRRLNHDHRGKDAPTNVLSFPTFDGSEPLDAGHIGDVAIAFETIVREAEAFARPPAAHLAHMVVHGVAHLAGFDHQSDAEADIMEAMEARALARMRLPNPYLEERVAE